MKTFETLVAVNGLDLEVMRGDVFGFRGQNDSGKTTTIRMLLGLIRQPLGTSRCSAWTTSDSYQRFSLAWSHYRKPGVSPLPHRDG